MDIENGVISPGGVGYDINCGMKFLKSEYKEEEIRPHLEKLATEIQKEVPSGLGQGRQIKLDISFIDKILEGGAQRIVEQGYGEKEDLENCESNGKLLRLMRRPFLTTPKIEEEIKLELSGSGNIFGNSKS